jgi:hypothetical protein
MVKVNHFGSPPPNQSAGFNQTNGQFQGNQSQFSEQPAPPPTQKGLISLPPSLMQFIP